MKKKDSRDKRSKEVVVTFSLTEYERLLGKFKQTTFQYLPQMIRHLVFGKPITVLYRNQSLDDFIERVVDLKNAFWETPHASDPQLLEKMEVFYFFLLQIYGECMQKQPFPQNAGKL
jgi:hypothetical protein